MLRFKIVCNAHNEIVKPAGDQYHLMPFDEHATPLAEGFYELDMADTWCPKSSIEHGEHAYEIRIVADRELRMISDVGTVK